ncbi:cation:proton antiporter [Halochromatium glycolicum]|uniref:Sodium:proton antiporter n=1 Tax=Halochromatium glycolicum TaxID=85075 RepID=A0AAJ0XBU6_9GAMM|nr:cation:proton antiporter [Halochromatium glycolicum]MBK1707329.1 sodium:proton antiporter [Halochromatium glycolicum]
MNEASSANGAVPILLTVGGIFLIGLCADFLGRHTFLPRVTLLLLAGILVGPEVLDLLPDFTEQWFPVLTNLALAMIGFLIGQSIQPESLRRLGRRVLILATSKVALAALLVFVGLLLLGVQLEAALLLAGIAPATAPAATFDVVHESQAEGEFTDTLLGIVAIDDGWGIILFSVLLSIAEGVAGTSGAGGVLLSALWELFGALALGALLALPMAYLTGRVARGEPTQAEALGFVLLCAGLALWAEVSYILACMTLGALVSSFAAHHKRPFRAIEGIEWPYLILFFLLAGASLHLDALATIGLLGVVYILMRSAGLYLGAQLGGRISGAPPRLYNWIGIAVLPQAGVALGLALVAAQAFPSLEDIILPTVLGTTVVFELIGPVAARFALRKAGEARA